jgi:hypothetical protein
MARRPTYLDQDYQSRRTVALRTGLKKIKGIDGEIIMAIYQNIGMQRFTHAEAKEMLAERAGIKLGQTTLGALEGWGWIDIVGETYEKHPRFIYQINGEMQDRLEAILTGNPINRQRIYNL